MTVGWSNAGRTVSVLALGDVLIGWWLGSEGLGTPERRDPGGTRQRPGVGQGKHLVESLRCVRAECPKRHQVEIPEAPEGAGDHAEILAELVGDAVTPVEADALAVGHEAEEGVDGDLLGGQPLQPPPSPEGGIDPTKRTIEPSNAVGPGHDDLVLATGHRSPFLRALLDDSGAAE
jgi:hypothetical protein